VLRIGLVHARNRIWQSSGVSGKMSVR